MSATPKNHYRVTIEIADNPEYLNPTKYGSAPDAEFVGNAHEFGEAVFRTLDKHEGLDYTGFTFAEVQR